MKDYRSNKAVFGLDQTIKARAAHGSKLFSRGEEKEYRANSKSVRRNLSLDEKRRKVAGKMAIYKQHAAAFNKFNKRHNA